jgi:hypothetical protein
MLSTGTSCRSARMPRIHTPAVISYSGVPTTRPRSCSGAVIPESRLTKIDPWRNVREGKTGIAIRPSSPAASEAQ